MITTTNIRTGRHCTFNMHIHLVFVTKSRKRTFTKNILDFMKEIFKDVSSDFGSELVEFDGKKTMYTYWFIIHPKYLYLN